MEMIKNVAIGVFFTVFFLIFILLGTIRFELLHSDFLFSSFQRHNVYARLPQDLAESLPNDPNLQSEELDDYVQIVKGIKPEVAQRMIENNVSQFLNYLNGESDELKVAFSLRELGLPGEDVQWTPAQMSDQNSVNIFKGLGQKVFWIWLGMLGVLVGLGFWLRKTKVVFIAGVMLTLIGTILRLLMLFLEKSMPTQLEPSQALIKLMASSLLADIFMTWIGLGIIISVIGIIMKRIKYLR